jgi:hypothetical protein
MFIFVIQTLEKYLNKICMEHLAGGKHMENNFFRGPRSSRCYIRPNKQLLVLEYKILATLEGI